MKLNLEEGMMVLFDIWEKKDQNYDQSPNFNEITDSFISSFTEDMNKTEVKRLVASLIKRI